MKKGLLALVTGGAGFIGSHVAKNLISNGIRVVIIDDLSGGFVENIPSKAVFVKCSINDINLLRKLFKKYRFDYVFHFAAYAAEGLSHFVRSFNYSNNLLGSVNLINLSVEYKVKRFIFASSIAVYGKGQLPMTEELLPSPEDPYGISKYAIELDLKAAHKMFGLNYTIFRPHNVYGENQNVSDPYRNVIGIFIKQAILKKPFTIFGSGNQTRAFTYIGDIAPIIASCVNIKGSENQIFNLGTNEIHTVMDVAKLVSDYFQIKLKVKKNPARKEVVNAYSDHKKSERTFKIKSYTSLNTGIYAMGKWVVENGISKVSFLPKIEISKNLPKSWTKVATLKRQ